jgi:hypothetical protein
MVQSERALLVLAHQLSETKLNCEFAVLILFVYNVLKTTKLWSNYVTMLEGNIEVLSRDFFCGKAISITYSECMSVARRSYSVCKTYVPCCIVNCGLSGSTVVFHTIS